MSVLNAFPQREGLQAVLMLRRGLGYAVGVGGLVSGQFDGPAECHLSERDAQTAALALSDVHDLIVVRD